MKGLAVYLAAGVVGAAAGTVGMGSYQALVVGLEPDSAAVEDSTHLAETGGEGGGGEAGPDPTGQAAGSTDAAPEGEDVTVDGSPDDPGTEGVEETPPEVVAAGGGAAGPAQTMPADPGPTEADAEAAARAQQNYPRLARIFAAMKPEEAAPVLAQLDDEQLEGILLAMQGRNAAPILAEMDPARVAAISRRVLGGNE